MTQPASKAAVGSKPRYHQILLVENNDFQEDALVNLLEQENFQLVVVQDGRRALEVMHARLPDLLVANVELSGMNGYQLCMSVREAFGANIPVILISALQSPIDLRRALDAGADSFVGKLSQPRHLLDQIQYLMAERTLRCSQTDGQGKEVENHHDQFTAFKPQQALDLLHSTYRQAVHLQQESEQHVMRLKAQAELQKVQLRITSALRECASVGEILTTSHETLHSIGVIEAVWFSVEEGPRNWRIEAGKYQKLSEGEIQPLCQCLASVGVPTPNPRPASCELTHFLNVAQNHICLAVSVSKKQYVMNALMSAPEFIIGDLVNGLSVIAHHIETHMQRVSLSSHSEEQVGQRKSESQCAEKQYRAIVESGLFGLLILTSDGTVTYQNSAAQKLLKYPKDKSFSFQVYLSPEKASLPLKLPLHEEQLKQLHEYHIRCANGDTLPVMLKFSQLDCEQQLWLVAFIDTSALRKAEASLVRMQRLESISSLTGGIAHDFQNLLSVILGNAEVLLDESVSQSEKDAASITIKKAAKSGTYLTNRLLAFAQRQDLLGEQVDVAQLIVGLKQLISRIIDKKIQINVNCDDDLWPIFTDYSQMESALLNLCINARDAMPDGGVLSLTTSNCYGLVSQESVSGEAFQGDFVRIDVRDTGFGIPKEIVANVFEPFFTTKEEGKGTGLGLSMVYGFVKQSQAYLRVESRPGDTCFSLFFPPFLAGNKAKTEAEREAPAQGEGQLVLVVEDDPDVRSVLVRHIQSLGYRYLEAEEADLALQLVEQHSHEIDVVLTDRNLPGRKSGLDLATHINRVRPQWPIVMVTGSSEGIENVEFHNPDRFQLLKKPFRRYELAQLLAKILKE